MKPVAATSACENIIELVMFDCNNNTGKQRLKYDAVTLTVSLRSGSIVEYPAFKWIFWHSRSQDSKKISNEINWMYRDVQHTGLQSTQTRRNYSSNNTGKQDAQTRGIFEFPSIPTSVAALHVKQPSRFFSICCYLELISISYNYQTT